MDDSRLEWLPDLSAGLMGLAVDDVMSTCDSVSNLLLQRNPEGCIVRYAMRSVPESSHWMHAFTKTFAEAALQYWPNWYRQTFSFEHAAEAGRGQDASFDEIVDAMVAGCRSELQHAVDPRWLRLAIRCVARNQVPFVPQYSLTQQLRQLAAALTGSPLVVLISATWNEACDDPRMMGLAAGCEWVAEQTGGAVYLVTDPAIARHRMLEKVPFVHRSGDENAQWQSGATATSPEANAVAEAARPGADRVAGRQNQEERKLVFPILGRPHPGSPGEQFLARALANDRSLAGMFEFNVRVLGVRGSSHVVDLLWRIGKVVVEVDGFRFHSREEEFRKDRFRDYELLISGYLVLRLPHDEVIADPLLAIEKIRDVVNFRIAENQ
ncbi:hypothetical protein Poly24_02740 [Rosistilla carotiformis]|uniref:DUF559 domain-containing protein n=1 Tax=Rosistilla carotiformis TaxID=2528017 RepID=A0A518JM71_9BACT|nr:DUF559 domain-containing protein [Rosistilla carotiformis]QDV66587.1 hypothetical protein Poly24_02740 [Rosistilla carotiformis]